MDYYTICTNFRIGGDSKDYIIGGIEQSWQNPSAFVGIFGGFTIENHVSSDCFGPHSRAIYHLQTLKRN